MFILRKKTQIQHKRTLFNGWTFSFCKASFFVFFFFFWRFRGKYYGIMNPLHTLLHLLCLLCQWKAISYIKTKDCLNFHYKIPTVCWPVTEFEGHGRKAEENFECSLVCVKMHYHSVKWALSLILLLTGGTRKVSKMSVSTCTFTAEVMAAIFPGPLPDINPISSVIVEMCLFYSGSHLYMVCWNWTKLKSQHLLLVQCRLVTPPLSSNHLQSMTASLYPTVTLFSSV